MSNYAFISDVKDMGDSVFNDDLFLFSKGCEDRSYTVFNKYISIISPKRSILIDSRLRSESLSADMLIKYNEIDSLIARDQTSNIRMISVESSYISKALLSEDISSSTMVSVDISSMNFWEISDLLCFLLVHKKVNRLNIFYTEPGIYHYENDDIINYDHKDYPVSINYINGYYSTNTMDEEILVSLIGFQKYVHKMVKDDFEVSQYYSINGFPSFYPKAKDISQTINDDFLSEIMSANKYSADAINPFITYNTLLAIRKASHNAYMNICPLCSKPMAIGACLFVIKHPLTSRIIYPYAETVTTKTDGVGRTYCYSVFKEFIG